LFKFDVKKRVLFVLSPSSMYENAYEGPPSIATVTFNVDASSRTGIAEFTSSSCVDLQLYDRRGKPAEIARSILVHGEYKAYAGSGACADDAVPLDCKTEERVDELEYFCKCRPLSWSNIVRS